METCINAFDCAGGTNCASARYSMGMSIVYIDTEFAIFELIILRPDESRCYGDDTSNTKGRKLAGEADCQLNVRLTREHGNEPSSEDNKGRHTFPASIG